MPELRELYAYIVIDGSGREGVLRRAAGPFGTQPMIADSREYLDQFRVQAEEAALSMSMRLRIVRFTRAETFEPFPQRQS